MRLALFTGTASAVLLSCFAVLAPLLASAQFAAPSTASARSIPESQLIQPDELNRILQSHGSKKPLILQVGSRVMYAQAHIPGSEYVGPGSQDSGLQLLQRRVAMLPRDTFIVIYCGCCPWNRCPNVGPAYNLLAGMGFKRAKVLYIADNFGADWANKEFSVASGQ
ncbi:MAG: rhodanese-like domain-containing protein [Terracidiphilus sp.]